MSQIVQIGCICCITKGLVVPYETPSEYTAIHHIDGKTKKDCHLKTIPICPRDHQEAPYSRHVNKKLFEQRFGTEEFLLEKTKQILEKNSKRTV